MNVLHEDDLTQIRHDPTLNCIEWEVKAFVQSQELMAFFEQVQSYTSEFNCDKNLVDMTKMGVIPEDVQDWFKKKWFPMMADLGVNLFVLVNAKSAITKMSVNRMEKDISIIKEKFGIETIFFDNINDARIFITSKN